MTFSGVIRPPYSARERWQAAYRDWRRGRRMLESGQHPADLARDTLRMFGPAFGRAFSAPFDRNIAAASVPWYLAGGAPTPIAVYQPKGAADLAASYVNLVTPGTYNAAPGTAPTFDAATGWTFAPNKYLTTGIVPVNNQSWAVLVRFSNATLGHVPLLMAVNTWSYGIGVNADHYSTGAIFWNGTNAQIATKTTSGVIGVAGTAGYLNGVDQGIIIPSAAGTITASFVFGKQEVDGRFLNGKIQAAVIWNTSTGHATWMPAVSAAVALI